MPRLCGFYPGICLTTEYYYYYYYYYYYLWVRHLVSHTEGGTWVEDVQEMGEEEDIWA